MNFLIDVGDYWEVQVYILFLCHNSLHSGVPRSTVITYTDFPAWNNSFLTLTAISHIFTLLLLKMIWGKAVIETLEFDSILSSTELCDSE